MNGVCMKYSKGLGLIEVLITMLILSTTLITLAALQTRSLQYNHGAYLGAQANVLASDILDRIRANRRSPSPVNAVQVANYNTTLAAFAGGVAPTTPLTARDLFVWRRNIDNQMPGARGGITCVNATMLCTIVIEWDEVNNTLAGRVGTSRFEYTTRM